MIELLKSDGTILVSSPDAQIITFDGIAFLVVDDDTLLPAIPVEKGTAIIRRLGSLVMTADYGVTWI